MPDTEWLTPEPRPEVVAMFAAILESLATSPRAQQAFSDSWRWTTGEERHEGYLLAASPKVPDFVPPDLSEG